MTQYDPKRREFLKQMAMMSSFASTLPGFSALADSARESDERIRETPADDNPKPAAKPETES